MRTELTRDTFPELRLVGFLAAVTWAIGTNWLGEWHYPIHGIGWVDLLFGAWLACSLAYPARRRALGDALQSVQLFVVLIVALVAVLLLSTLANAARYGAEMRNVFAIARLLYFAAIVVFVSMLVGRGGFRSIVLGFVVGVALLTLGRVYDAFVFGAPVIRGVVLLKDPNVIGNMLGIGAFFCSLGVLAGFPKLSMVAAFGFAAASVATFSKGTWLMVMLGLVANGVAATMLPKEQRSARHGAAVLALMVVAVGGWLAYANADLLEELIRFKLETTYDSDTAVLRYQYAVAGLYAMLDFPLAGLGFGNYTEVARLYPSVIFDPGENAHNAFLQMAAVGGVPAFTVLLILFCYPFLFMFAALRRSVGAARASVYTVLALTIFGLSGSVQLQLTAQPFFWVFAGIVMGWWARLQRDDVLRGGEA